MAHLAATATAVSNGDATSTTTTTSGLSKTEVKLRDAHYSELCAIARLMTLAFWNDHIFGTIIHPHKNKYPLDGDLYWLKRLRVCFWDYRYKLLVAVVPDSNGIERIVGTAWWERFGEGGKALECKWWDPRNMMKPISAIGMAVHERIWPNRATNPELEDIIERSYPYFEHTWGGKRAESWYLAFLAVHPDHQGHGIGKRLTMWGLDIAEKEQVTASVISANGQEGFYQICGFHEQFGSARDGEGNPLAFTEEGSYIFWRWPGGKQR